MLSNQQSEGDSPPLASLRDLEITRSCFRAASWDNDLPGLKPGDQAGAGGSGLTPL